MIVLDTTVLVYATGAEHPLRGPARHVLERAAAAVPCTTTTQVIQEFAHVRSRTVARADAAELAGRARALLSPLLGCGEAELADGLHLFAGASRLGAFDCVLAAAAAAGGASLLISADRAFAEQSAVTWLDLAAPDLVERLAATPAR